MLSAVLRGPGDVGLRPAPEPELTGPGQVVLRNLVSTICGSDLHLVDGGAAPDAAHPGFPGHESVGVVEQSSDPAVAVGDLVLAVPDLAHAGGFAQRQVLPSGSVIGLPADAVPEDAVLAQQLGTVVYAMKRFWPDALPVPEGATAVVLGAGPVGLFFTRLCRRAGFAQVVVTDLHPHRLQAARALGATRTVDAAREDVAAAVRDSTAAGAELVVEAAGTDATRLQALDLVQVSGRLGMFGMPAAPTLQVPFERLFRLKPTVEFCWGAQAEPGLASFRTALDLLAAGEVDTAALALRLWPFEELPEALRRAREGTPEVVKTGVRFA